MIRSRLTPRDDDGKPRRFTRRGEALRWSAVFAAQAFGVFVTPFVVGPVIYFLASPFMEETPFSGVYMLVLPAMLFAAYLAVTVALYSYIALAGGIMSGEERRSR